ncbi:non-functional pseudokinase ZED1-like [Coffea eugenioides]|uniref:non-functional pseudokinase ZED1-like n=1 Tax=Coffea eugenioides TaxID=49369 RepID=UPI000F604719|nr:non-functional pseudokinase ZED1-like [Coffea eugenioides]
MDKLRNVLPFYKRKEEKEHFRHNGSLLLEGLISCFGGRYELPIRSFTAGEVIRATNNFSEQVNHIALDSWKFFRGNLQDRPILVKFGEVGSGAFPARPEFIIRGIVVNSQMSHLKNVLHLIGCCLEFELPALVYAYAPGMESLPHSLSYPRNGQLISWKSRIKIASDIANVLLYLHTAFPSPIIFRNLKLASVILDSSGVAKLFGFEFSISLPPGEKKIEDEICGTSGYLDPEYFKSGFVTEKSDVYSLGVFILLLITGETRVFKDGEPTIPYFKRRLENDQLKHILDPKSFEEEGYNEHEIEQHLLPFTNLALRCTEEKGEDRPDMIEVAKQLRQIEKSCFLYPYSDISRCQDLCLFCKSLNALQIDSCFPSTRYQLILTMTHGSVFLQLATFLQCKANGLINVLLDNTLDNSLANG